MKRSSLLLINSTAAATMTKPHRVQKAAGSRRTKHNNNDNPYCSESCRSIDEYDIESFVRDAIRSHRAVVFLKGCRTDPLSRALHGLFSENCASEDLAFYHLDHVPTMGDSVRDFLADRCNEPTQNCFVFVRGRHVPLWHLQKVLAARASASPRTTISRE